MKNFMKKFADTLIILVFVWVAVSLGCATTSEVETQDNSYLERYDWMERFNWMESRNSTGEVLDYTDIWYIKDPRTGLCFAFYLNLPLGRVPCDYAKSALTE